tara:strand:- start:476 stop:721 length:246 start_codon:yes stop_codon:yes gene_type:complete
MSYDKVNKLKREKALHIGGVSESLFTQEQFDYVMNVPEIYLRSHLLHQVRLRDNMEADRNSFEKMYNELLSKYNARQRTSV